MHKILHILKFISVFLVIYLGIYDISAATPVVKCNANGDQDDMVIWLHPVDPAQSTIITSDKEDDALYVYDLSGTRLFSYDFNHAPGNVDIRYDFPFGDRLIDLVGYDIKNEESFEFYEVDQESRELIYLGSVHAPGWEGLYGFCLYHSPNNDKFYAFASDYESLVQQYHIYESGGEIAGTKVRSMQNGTTMGDGTEGIVADDELGLVYIANENDGIHVYEGDEDGPEEPIRIIPIKEGELEIELEGVTIYYAADNGGYLIASSQYSNFFSVFERKGDNKFVGTFEVSGVKDTDGIDVLNVNLGAPFEEGVFVCHNGNTGGNTVELVTWKDVSDDISPDLLIDTEYWNPRDNATQIQSMNNAQKPSVVLTHPHYMHVMEPGKFTITLLKVNGQNIQETTGFYTPGIYRNPFSFSATSGSFLLRIVNEEQSFVKRIMITN